MESGMLTQIHALATEVRCLKYTQLSIEGSSLLNGFVFVYKTVVSQISSKYSSTCKMREVGRTEMEFCRIVTISQNHYEPLNIGENEHSLFTTRRHRWP